MNENNNIVAGGGWETVTKPVKPKATLFYNISFAWILIDVFVYGIHSVDLITSELTIIELFDSLSVLWKLAVYVTFLHPVFIILSAYFAIWEKPKLTEVQTLKSWVNDYNLY